jgi:hypothetical protein
MFQTESRSNKLPGLDAIDIGGPRFDYLVGDDCPAQNPEFAVTQNRDKLVKRLVGQAPEHIRVN